ncbi:MAG: ornithine cyclodeaminase [Rhodocyclaceae bacterium]
MSVGLPVETLFLDARDVARLVASRGVARCLRDLTDYLHSDFLRWPAFEKAARLASHSQEGVIELMPISDGLHYSFKYVNGHPRNTVAGMPTVMAFGVLADVATGAPLLLSELTLATALRTAATSALAARHLARRDCHRMALIGCGAQSEFQALAFQHLLGIDEVQLFDVDSAAMEKLTNNLWDSGLRVVPCADVAAAVQGADIVTTITADKRRATVIHPEMLEPGMHLNAVGGDCPGKTELHADVLRRARVVVEYEAQTRVEGDLQQMPADFAVTELWEVLADLKPGRQDDAQITVFDSVGFALEDFSALRYLHVLAQALKLGRLVSLVGAAADPKDLFGSLGLPTSGESVEQVLEALAHA